MIYFWKHIQYREVEVAKGYKKKTACVDQRKRKTKKAVVKTENEIV